jgi:hypothetical protein
MIESHELFKNLHNKDLGIHVELSDNGKYAVKGKGTILFHLESSSLLEAQDVLYVPRLKKNFILALVMEYKGFSVMFKRGKTLICLEGAILTQH